MFKKKSDNIYQIEERCRYEGAWKQEVLAKLELETTLGFIKSAKLYIYHREEVEKCSDIKKRNILIKKEVYL